MIKIGSQFQEERIRQKLTLSEVSKATRIREEFLAAIERGDYKKLPSPAYAHGFVSNYAKFLGLPVDKSLAIFRREFNSEKSMEVLPKGFSKESEYKVPKFRLGRSAVLLGIVLAAIGGFLFFQYRSAFFDPSLNVEIPVEDETVKSLTVEVRGKTDSNSTLFVENEQVPVGSDGTFRKEITVFPGKSKINFQVENKFGRKTNLERNITVKPSD